MADVFIRDMGTTIIVRPMTDNAKAFFEDKVKFESWQRMGPWIVADHRPAKVLLDGLAAEGFAIRAL